jgi:hypothetical protein
MLVERARGPQSDSLPVGRRRFPPGPLLRDIEDLDEPAVRPEEVLRVPGARVVLYDEALLVHDFPELHERSLTARDPALAQAGEAERRGAVRRIHHDWLIRHAALISQTQAQASAVSTRIATGDTVSAYRPPRYGRALVTSIASTSAPPGEGPARGAAEGGTRASEGGAPSGAKRPASARGLLDLKGAGVAPGKKPHLGPYGSGLCSLYRVLSDTFYQWLLDEIFARAAPSLWTMPVYGVLDLGFDLLTSPPAPAALQIRRAHRRPRSAIELPKSGSTEEILKLEVELILRNYGLTSCTQATTIHVGRKNGRLRVHHAGMRVPLSPRHEERILTLTGVGLETLHFEGVNVQLAREVGLHPRSAQLLDFGQYSVRDTFHNPLASLVRDQQALLGRIVWPDSPHYVQPDPRVRLSRALHASTATSQWTADLARRFRAGQLSGEEVRAQLDERVTAATRRWGTLR